MDNKLGRFISADSVIPGAGSPQSWDRYSYVSNNALKFTDPSGHMQAKDPYKVTKGPEYEKYLKDHPPKPILPTIYTPPASNKSSSNGSTWTAPPTRIGPPYFDPAGDAYGSASTSIQVGSPDIVIVGDAYKEAPPTGNPADLAARFVNVFANALVDLANTANPAGQEPNVSLSLYYNNYGLDTQISGLRVDNNSDYSLALNRVVVIGTDVDISLSPGTDIFSVPPHSPAGTGLDLPRIHSPGGLFNVRITFQADQSTYMPKITFNAWR